MKNKWKIKVKVKSFLIWSAVLMRKEEKRDRPMGILPWPYFFKDFKKHQIILYIKKRNREREAYHRKNLQLKEKKVKKNLKWEAEKKYSD